MIRTSLIVLIFLTYAGLVRGKVTYCPQVIFESEKIDFTDTEIQLFCGDPKSHAYRNIPAYEAQFVIKGFLQSRGYLSPQFDVKDKTLFVKIGKKSFVKKIRVISQNDNLGKKIKRELRHLYRRRELTTGMLNSLESEALAQIRRKGYPCGKISSPREFCLYPFSFFSPVVPWSTWALIRILKMRRRSLVFPGKLHFV